MKKIAIFLFLAMFTFSAINAQESSSRKKVTSTEVKKTTPEATKAATPAKKPNLVGRVALLNDLNMGNYEALTVARAQTALEKSQPLVLLVGKGKSAKVHFLYNGDGSYASKRLAELADKAEVKVWGKAKNVNGLNVMILNNIE